MDRCAIFVDAGYLYAAGGRLCCRVSARDKFDLDASALLPVLAEMARRETGLPALRTYWYDAAQDGIRTIEQSTIAGLSNVKLRLGRLNTKKQQKGVDALIYRDLITLAQQRSICDAVLLSGDEDLREGVRAAQDYGVRVVIVGIATHSGNNQSLELILEADQHLMLNKKELTQFFKLRGTADDRNLTSSTNGRGNALSDGRDIARSTTSTAVAFAKHWVEAALENELVELLRSRPAIPRPLDVELLNSVGESLQIDLREREDLRHAARAAFWGVVGPLGDSKTVARHP